MHVDVCPHLYLLPPSSTHMHSYFYTPSTHTFPHIPHILLYTPSATTQHALPYTPVHTFPYTPLHTLPSTPLPYTPSPMHPTPTPAPCSNMLEVQQWIIALNQAAAMYSSAPLASAVGSQNKFVRPMYPMKPASSDSVRGGEERGRGRRNWTWGCVASSLMCVPSCGGV